MLFSKKDIQFVNKIAENLTIQDLKECYFNDIIIFTSGSYDYISKKGTYFYVLEYKGQHSYMEKSIENATSNKVMIEALTDAVSRIARPCRIISITATALGFEKGFKGKGVNAGAIQNLYSLLQKKECSFTEVQFINGANLIKQYIMSLNPDKEQKKKYEEKREQKLTQGQIYTQQMICGECISKIIEVLLEEQVDQLIIDKVKNIPYE